MDNLDFTPGLRSTNVEIFNSVTMIKPAPNSSRLFRNDKGQINDAIIQEWGIDNFGQKVLINSEPYKAERFGGTIQTHGAEYSYSYNRWLIIDPTDPYKKRLLDKNSEIINELVLNCRLINQRQDHPHTGQYITQANIFDRYDPFFTHPLARIKLEGGEAFLQSSNSDYLTVVVLLALLARKKFQLGTNSPKGLRSSQVKYIIIDSKLERQEKTAKRRLDNEARDAYRNLDNDRKLKILVAYGITSINLVRIDYQLIDDLLYDIATDFETKYQNTQKTKAEAFLELVNSSPDTIEAHYAIYLGIKCNVVRILNKSYTAFGQRIGVTIADCIRVLLSQDNNMLQDILTACEAYLNDTKNGKIFKQADNIGNDEPVVQVVKNKKDSKGSILLENTDNPDQEIKLDQENSLLE